MILRNMNPVLKKSLFALIVAMISVALLVIIYFCQKPGKIIGIICFTLVAMFTIFEFVKPFQMPTWTKFVIPFSAVFSMLIPFDEAYISFINVDNKLLTELPSVSNPTPQYADILLTLIRDQFIFSVGNIPGIGFPILTLFILIPCLFIENKKKIFINFIIILIIVILITFSIKFLLYFTILQFSLLITLIAAVVLTDTMAYFGGKLFGNKVFKKKLAPSISPNKTIEGAIIGFLFSSMFLFLIFGLNFAKIPGGINFGKLGAVNNLLLLYLIPILIPIIAILGDLLFSFVKRTLSIKDFSNLIPEHGGVLDRFDSLILVIVTFGFLILVGL